MKYLAVIYGTQGLYVGGKHQGSHDVHSTHIFEAKDDEAAKAKAKSLLVRDMVSVEHLVCIDHTCKIDDLYKD